MKTPSVPSIIVKLAVWCGLGALVYALVSLAPAALGHHAAPLTVELRVAALPRYVLLSLARMTAAYALSIVFTVIVGYAAARSRLGGRLIPPVLDVMQSIPVLSFLPAVLLGVLALAPGRRFGLEVASVILIFTGMVWNLTFSFYHSLLTIPPELSEASRMLGLGRWHRLTTLELPMTVIGFVWNSVMSWAGGWFFLMASESFTLANDSFTLPGLGSYLALASSQGNLPAISAGIGALLLVVILLDQLVWVPLIVWSGRFKVELNETTPIRRSWVLEFTRGSRTLGRIRGAARRAVRRLIDRAPTRSRGSRPFARSALRLAGVVVAVAAAGALMVGVIRGAMSLVGLTAGLPVQAWTSIAVAAAATTGRVAAALVITFAWTLPAGIAIGTRPRVARIVQPLAQIAASVPATAVFPVLLMLLLRPTGSLSLASLLLMLLGTQWYVLFNVIAGATALPRDLQEASAVLRLRGMVRWRMYLLPAIFPFLVTGGLTAQGGAFNASVVSEYVTFAGRTVQTVGLGAVIAMAAARGDFPLLAASTMTMAALVVVLNRVLWRPMANLARDRYHV